MSCGLCENLRPPTLEHAAPGQRCTISIWRAALRQSVTDGRCAECRLLFDAIVTAKGEETVDWEAESKSIRLTIAEGLPLQINDGSEGLFLEVYRPSCQPADCGLPTTIGYEPLVSKRSDSDESVAMIRSWLSECESNHHFCKRSTSCSQPTRLLQLSGTGTGYVGMRLVDSSNSHDRYVALSYSWGSPSGHYQLKTTKALLGRHRDNIDFNTLPRTLQDAAVLTNTLGLQYLWVDALCIIQDDEEDWSIEAARMSDVYMNAMLTLVASRSTGSSDPLFGEHSYALATEVPYRGDSVFVRERRGHFNEGTSTADYKIDPLVTRAWALQEAMLSNRAVYFSSQELRWECNESSRCQCGGLKKDVHDKDEFDHRIFRVPELFSFDNIQDAYEAWHIAVMNYSNRYLTYDRDRLVALSGLARQFSKMMRVAFKRDDLYLAGIWSGWLPKGLLWHVEPLRFSIQRGRRHERPSVWRAPSWSWASMEAPVIFSHVNDLENPLMILNTCIDPLTDDPFGEIRSASLRIQGRLLTDVIPAERSVVYDVHRYAAFQYKGLPLRTDVCLVDEEYNDLPATISLLVVGYRASDVHEVLLLDAVESVSATYRRLGTSTLGAHFREPDEHKQAIVGASIQEITLI